MSSPSSLAAALQPFVDRHELAGAVVLAAGKDSIHALETVGCANIEAGTPMPADAMFWIASMSKPITGAALMMLVDEGRVRIDDPVETYLPEFAGQWLITEADEAHQVLRKPAHPITVRNVLTHTSGLPFRSDMEVPTLDLLPLRVAAKSYAMTPLQFAPDSKYEYSNAGINTAGRIIEVVTGIPYEDFLDQRLLGPLGMTDTTFWPNAAQTARLARVYRPGPEQTGLELVPTIEQLSYPLENREQRYPMPAGGLFSTARDVCRFAQMVLNNGVFAGKRYLSEAAVREMTSKQTGDAVEVEYGYGWAADQGTFGHGGALATNMIIDPARGLITIYLVQHCGFPGEGGKSFLAFKTTADELYGA